MIKISKSLTKKDGCLVKWDTKPSPSGARAGGREYRILRYPMHPVILIADRGAIQAEIKGSRERKGK